MNTKPSIHRVAAVVTDVLPKTGLAYLTGEDGTDWTVTKSTPGAGLNSLSPGRHVDLTIKHHGDVRLVDAYTVSQQAGTTPVMAAVCGSRAVCPSRRGTSTLPLRIMIWSALVAKLR